MKFGTPPPPASSFLSQIPRPEIESASPLPWASPKDFKRAFYRPRPPNLHTLCLFVLHLFTVSSFCFAPVTHPLCTDPLSLLSHMSPSLVLPPLIIPSTSADLTNYKVNGDPTFNVSIHPKVRLSSRPSILLWCLRQGVYLCIHTLKDFQIAVIRLSSPNKKICCSWS